MRNESSKTGHPGWEHEGKPLKAAAHIPEGQSTPAEQNGYASNPMGFPHTGIIAAHGIRRG